MQKIILVALVFVFSNSMAQVPSFPSKITMEQGATFPTGTRQDAFVSETEDGMGPFRHRAVIYKGWKSGGSQTQLDNAYLIYRFRIEFPEKVKMKGINIRGAGHQGDKAQLRLLNAENKVVASRMTVGFNVLDTTNLEVPGITGNVFYLEEYDYSTAYRYRERIELDYEKAR